MTRTTRVAPLLVALAAALAACARRQPAPPPVTTVSNADSAARADAEARERARQDSIAAAERAAAADRDAAARARMEEARNTLAAVIYFDYDRAELSPEARAILDRKVPLLTANPGLRIRVAGHTDSRGSDEYNLALGQRRAAAAKRYLTQRGIDGGRIDIVSFGEERPAAPGDDEAAYSQNRRDEFEIVAGGENLTIPSE